MWAWAWVDTRTYVHGVRCGRNICYSIIIHIHMIWSEDRGGIGIAG